MATIQELQAKVQLLGGRCVINSIGDDDYIQVVFPLTKYQQKVGIMTGDFISSCPLSEAWEFTVRWEEMQSLRHELKKKEIKEFVQNKLRTRDAWALHALEVIMSKQTVEEQRADRTVFHNNVGFSGHDSPLLSSFAKQYRDKKWLSAKQMIVLKKTISKYWSQIIDNSNELKLLRQVKAARNAVQTVLPLR